MPVHFDLERPERIHHCVNIVRNFLNYVLYHNVCPEYSDQIYAARAVCDLAEKELGCIADVSVLLPGDFNMACSTLYGGHYKGLYGGDQDWASNIKVTLGMSDTRAAQVIEAAFTAYGAEDEVELIKDAKNLHLTMAEEMSVEVTEIVLANGKTRSPYENKLEGSFKTLGKLYVKRWINPYAAPEDITDDENDGKGHQDERTRINKEDESRYEIWVEDEILQRCFVGMKMDVSLRQLTVRSGKDSSKAYVHTCIDAVYGVYCSFYTNLANEMMIGWKKPIPIIDGKVQDGNEEREWGGDGEEDGDGDGDDVDGDRDGSGIGGRDRKGGGGSVPLDAEADADADADADD